LQLALVLVAYCSEFQLLLFYKPRFYDTGRHATKQQELNDGVADVAALSLVLVAERKEIVRT
jgi:hypothetical protein